MKARLFTIIVEGEKGGWDKDRFGFIDDIREEKLNIILNE